MEREATRVKGELDRGDIELEGDRESETNRERDRQSQKEEKRERDAQSQSDKRKLGGWRENERDVKNLFLISLSQRNRYGKCFNITAVDRKQVRGQDK